ncbi:MAG TPA: hypothetical protein VER17_19995 [Tepidisphaeraceae bacterium]|nr:hypothetical protein [Tepidisphaeraceae bacterium]
MSGVDPPPPPAPPVRPGSRARRRRAVLSCAWIVFLVGCALLSGWKARQNRAVAKQYRDYNAALNAAARSIEAQAVFVPDLYYQLHNAWSKRTGPQPTTRVVEQRLNDGQPFTLMPGPRGGMIAHWIQPTSGVKWTLFFDGGTWSRFERGSTAPTPPPFPPPPAGYAEVEFLRRQIHERGPWAWLALAALAVGLIVATVPRRRRWLRAAALLPAHLMMAVGILCALALLLPPFGEYVLPFYAKRDFTRDLLARCGMIAIGGAAVWRLARGPRVRRHGGRCAECGYDLTGNQSGVCPECGTPARPPATAGDLVPSLDTPGEG